MDEILVKSRKALSGDVRISGSKNGTLPLLAGALLVDGETIIENVPHITDVAVMVKMLRALGAKCELAGPSTLRIDASTIDSVSAPYNLVREMRGSFYVAGALLARFGECQVPLPGGCVIGARPVDYHISGFKALGAEITEKYGVMRAQASRLKGSHIFMNASNRSVGATVNLMLAASLAEGTTVIHNASYEPEVVACQEFLSACGVDISGIGGGRLVIEGQDSLQETMVRSIPDRMEAGTFLYATTASGGDVMVHPVRRDDLEVLVDVLRRSGAEIAFDADAAHVRGVDRPLPVDIVTAPFPGFPTDLQPAHGVLSAIAKGTAIIEETIFEGRFNYIDELSRMGADLRIVDSAAVIKGQPRLYGAPVEATDIRAGAALLIGALIAEGNTLMANAHLLDRGYERIVEKLQALGADIERRGQTQSRKALCLA